MIALNIVTMRVVNKVALNIENCKHQADETFQPVLYEGYSSIYYLKLDKQDGFYFSSGFTPAKKNFPLSLWHSLTKSFGPIFRRAKTLFGMQL